MPLQGIKDIDLNSKATAHLRYQRESLKRREQPLSGPDPNQKKISELNGITKFITKNFLSLPLQDCEHVVARDGIASQIHRKDLLHHLLYFWNNGIRTEKTGSTLYVNT